jgi:hypothetical protein
MSVDGEVTTYTLDYANKGQILLEQGGAFAQTKHYLYGLECIGELACPEFIEGWTLATRKPRNGATITATATTWRARQPTARLKSPWPGPTRPMGPPAPRGPGARPAIQ